MTARKNELELFRGPYRAGDRVEYTFDGVKGQGGVLTENAGGLWQGRTGIDTIGGPDSRVTDLRVYRWVPSLPTAEGTVIQWFDKFNTRQIAQRKNSGYWWHNSMILRTDELQHRIGNADVSVAEFTPLPTSD